MYSLTPYPITPIGNFIGVVLALLPLLSNIRKLSLAVWGYGIWIAIYDFTYFVNTIVWRDNVNVVVPVWCDIVTKLQLGAQIGTRTCTLAICIHLYRITRLRGPLEGTKRLKLETTIYELCLILGLPFVIMALSVIVQPLRFEISEEAGCQGTEYSYVTYIIEYIPPLMSSVGCIILAPLTLRAFMRHRKEMGEFLSSGRSMTYNRYYRLVVIACLDTLLNLPLLVVNVAISVARGKGSVLNYPYISWKNVHVGMGGDYAGYSLGSIVQLPASVWSADKWDTFVLKWDEWCYVLHALMFFCVFGTTPEMRSYYRTAFWFIPRCFGYKRSGQRGVSLVETLPDVAFAGRDLEDCLTTRRSHGTSAFLETMIDSASATRSEFDSDSKVSSPCQVVESYDAI